MNVYSKALISNFDAINKLQFRRFSYWEVVLAKSVSALFARWMQR
jgi:hypothetical protein